MKGAYNLGPWDYQQNIALLGMLFEKVDPLTTAHRVPADPLPGVPPKQLLLYVAMGDSPVANVASATLARAPRVPVTGPSTREPYGPVVQPSAMPSGMTIYDEGVSPRPPEHNAMGVLGDLGDGGALGVEVHVGEAGQHRALVEQRSD